MMIKSFKNLLLLILTATLLLFFTACGGGGGGGGVVPVPQKVTATFALQGSPASVDYAQLNVVLPDSFILDVDGSGEPTASALSFLVTGSNVLADATYTPATASTNGMLDVAIISVGGFPTATSLMQISHIYAVGETLPTADDFIVTVDAGDGNGNTLPGITGTLTITSQDAP